jgi:hypothetical protein
VWLDGGWLTWHGGVAWWRGRYLEPLGDACAPPESATRNGSAMRIAAARQPVELPLSSVPPLVVAVRDPRKLGIPGVVICKGSIGGRWSPSAAVCCLLSAVVLLSLACSSGRLRRISWPSSVHLVAAVWLLTIRL